MIGDCQTAALVSREGDIDWLCLPRFDSSSCFGALLGSDDHGRWSIAPMGKIAGLRRSYLQGSLILVTEFETETGSVELTDFMAVGQGGSHLVRVVRGLRGTVDMRFSLTVRFGYGGAIPWAEQRGPMAVAFIAGPDLLLLRSPIALQGDDNSTREHFSVAENESLAFVLSYSLSHQETPKALDVERASRETRAFWTNWSARCRDVGRWTEQTRRSLITLKGLSYLPTGAIVAAATTSLPEKIGSSRNWDYRYCWLRDSAFTLLAFLRAGYAEEARSFRDWLLRAVAGSPDQIQIMYGVGGERWLDERELPWLPGYEKSAPVRIGNAAALQSQLDIFGELVAVMTLAMKGGLAPVERSSKLTDVVLAHLQDLWTKPDRGIWEVRGPPLHFTLSKVMAWVAFDRAASREHLGTAADRARYRLIADEIHASVCSNGVDEQRNCFTQAYDVGYMDAGLLLIPLVGFLPPEDPRVRNTIAEIERRLLVDGLVLRYETQTAVDGLPPGEGAFIACSFWLVDNYILQGRIDEAEALFERLVELSNDVGLLAEQYDPRARRQLGNFPQAFSHVAMVNSAFRLAGARNFRAGYGSTV
jgi:GH15 family glucan-1,4-alpha-glucosidase